MLSITAEVSLSKFMTKPLRHTPEQYGLILDQRMVPVGWMIYCLLL